MFRNDVESAEMRRLAREAPTVHQAEHGRWWRYAVVRGPGIPASLNGRWYDLDEMPAALDEAGAVVEATDRWEQRDDGAVAVVYEWIASR